MYVRIRPSSVKSYVLDSVLLPRSVTWTVSVAFVPDDSSYVDH
ncbi:hypothetical protein [Streptomyces sp. NPDC051572]